MGVEGYSTYFYILAFFKAKWLTAHGTRQLQIFQVAYARFPDKGTGLERTARFFELFGTGPK